MVEPMQRRKNNGHVSRRQVLAGLLLANIIMTPALAAEKSSFFGPVNNGILHFTKFPEHLGIGISGGSEEKRNVALSVLQLISVSADVQLKKQPDIGKNSFAIIFEGDSISGGKVDFKNLSRFNFSDYYKKLLDDSAAAGLGSCASAVNFSKDGLFDRGVVVANDDISDQELMVCVADAQAHAFGIGTNDQNMADSSRFYSRIMILAEQKKKCLDASITEVTCKFVKEP